MNAKPIQDIKIEPAPFWYKYGTDFVIPFCALFIGCFVGWALNGINQPTIKSIVEPPCKDSIMMLDLTNTNSKMYECPHSSHKMKTFVYTITCTCKK